MGTINKRLKQYQERKSHFVELTVSQYFNYKIKSFFFFLLNTTLNRMCWAYVWGFA